MSEFTTVLGNLGIVGGVVQLFGIDGVEGAFLLFILGAYLVLKPYLKFYFVLLSFCHKKCYNDY